MRKSSILQILTRSSVAVGLGAMSLFGGIAHAETFHQRVQAELNRGKDYSAAWAEASRATGPLYASPDTRSAQSALYQGKDYVGAWEEASRAVLVFSPEQIARAQKAREKINEGKDYVSAWEAAGTEQPEARVQASTRRAGAGGQERTRSTK